MRPTTAVVVNFNGGDALSACIESLAALRRVELIDEFWIVDNASTDGSFQPEEIEQSGGVARAMGANVGFAAAHNRVAASIGPTDLLLLNPDATAIPRGIRAMQRELETDPLVAAVGGALQLPDGTFQPSEFPEPTVLTALAHLSGLRRVQASRAVARIVPRVADLARPYYRTTPGSRRDVDWLVGSCVLLRREALEELGGLDERFFLYYEEIDWCRRARMRGWTIRYVPEPAAYHEIGRSASQAKALAASARYTSMRRYYAKHHGRWRETLIRVVGVAGFLPRLAFGDRLVAAAALKAFLRPDEWTA